mgnify:CR=1 FL=1
MHPGSRATVWSAGLGVLLVAVVLASAAVGSVRVHPVVVAQAALDALPGITYDVPPTRRTIVVGIRLPRVVLAAVVGFSLATAGTVMQGFFRNPMADPSIIGVSAGAALGAVAVIALGPAVPFGIEGAAFIGAVAAAAGVYLIATEGGRTPVATLLLSGIAVQTFLGALVSLLLLASGESLREAVFWLMGHLANSEWGEVATVLPIVLVGFGLMLPFAEDLNILLLGEEEAHSLGIPVGRVKLILLVGASLVTAAGVAVAGIIGFVGLIVPHVMRLLVGPDHRVLLPTSALAGAAFLVAADTAARAGPAELPVGIVTAFVGAPFFLYLLRTEEVVTP